MKLEGAVAIVTGSSYGIGEAIAALFLKEGARVVINSRDGQRAEEAASRFRAAGYPHVLPVAADVADRDAVQRMVEKTVGQWGKVDVLVNNAGVSAISPSADLEPDRWRRTLDVNLSGSFWCAQAVAKRSMIPRQEGRIVNIASIAGDTGLPRRAAYVAAKHGLIGLTKALAVEWAQHKIRVNALCPGYILTPMEVQDQASGTGDYTPDDIKRRTPMGRYGAPEECAKACLFLASNDSDYVNGVALLQDGGWVAYGGW
jgi:3-oxoacyl-[acyl-carrier protein] reductase